MCPVKVHYSSSLRALVTSSGFYEKSTLYEEPHHILLLSGEATEEET